MQEWSGHALLGLRAAEALPEWEMSLLQPDMRPDSLARPFFPKIHSVVEKLAAMCLILDWVYIPEFRRYCLQPGGRWVPHTLAAADGSAAITAQKPVSCTANLALLQDMLQALVVALQARDWEEALRRAGVLGHFVQEPFTPGHSTNNELFAQIFPDPVSGRHLRMHHFFDSASGDFQADAPRLLGTSVKECALNLLEAMRRGGRDSRKYIPAVVTAAYAGADPRRLQEILAPASQQAASLTASAWHSAFCLAFQRFEAADCAWLAERGLGELLPIFIHPSLYQEVIPGYLVENGYLQPLWAWEKDGLGRQREVHISAGFAMYGHAGIKYFLGSGVYHEFRCRVGLPSRARSGQDEHTRVLFAIETDAQENTVYSEDIEYGAQRQLEIELLPDQPLQEITVPLQNASTMLLTARCFPYTSAEGDSLFSIPSVIIAEPVLCKNAG